ncbi:MAG: hypothetical protein WBO36_04305 [Saprospiraceae bacterium]
MAAIVLTSEFYDDYGQPWAIHIYDSTGSTPSLHTARTPKGSITLTDEGDDNDPFKRIIAKKLSWTILMHTDEYTAPQRAAILDVYNGLVSSPEGRYYVVMLQGVNIKFRGKLLADVGDLSLSYHKELSLIATDGILQLKEIEYRPVGYSDQLPIILTKIELFKDHFRNILQKNDVCSFFYRDAFTLTSALFTTSTNWTHAGVTGDVFATVAKKNNYYDSEETDLLNTQLSAKYRRYYNCYEVLTDLLTGFNMRMIFADGCYHIEALGYQDNLTLVRYAYDYDGLALGSYGNKITADITADNDIYVLADPSIKHMPPFKAVTLKQNKKYNNLLAGLDLWYHRTESDNRGPHNLGYVIGEGSQLVFDLRFIIEMNMPSVWSDNLGVSFEFSLKIGDFYLKNNPIKDNYIRFDGFTNTYEVMEFLWTTTPSTIKLHFGSAFFGLLVQAQNIESWNNYIGAFQKWSITGISDELPEDGECIVEMISWKALHPNSTGENAALTPLLVRWAIDKRSRIYIVTNGLDGLNKVPDNTLIYEVGNPKNTIIYETKMSYFDADLGLGFYNFHALWLYFGGTSYSFTEEWTDADMGDTLPIQELLLKQMIAMRQLPNKVVRLTMGRTDGQICNMDDRFAIGSDLYIPLRMIHNVDSGVYQMSLWSPIKDYDGINITRFTDYEPVRYAIASPIDPARALGSNTITYYMRFENVNDPYVEIDEDMRYYTTDSAEYDEIDTYWDVYKNGVRLDYKDRDVLIFPLSDGDLQMHEYTINTPENRFYFAFNQGDTIVVKYRKS